MTRTITTHKIAFKFAGNLPSTIVGTPVNSMNNYTSWSGKIGGYSITS